MTMKACIAVVGRGEGEKSVEGGASGSKPSARGKETLAPRDGGGEKTLQHASDQLTAHKNSMVSLRNFSAVVNYCVFVFRGCFRQLKRMLQET